MGLESWGQERGDNQTIKGRRNIPQSRAVRGLWGAEQTALCTGQGCLAFVGRVRLATQQHAREASFVPCPSATICLPLRSWLCLSLDLVLELRFAFGSPKSAVLYLVLELQNFSLLTLRVCCCFGRNSPPSSPRGGRNPTSAWYPRASSSSLDLVLSCSRGARVLTVMLMIPCHRTKINYILDSLRRPYLSSCSHSHLCKVGVIHPFYRWGMEG